VWSRALNAPDLRRYLNLGDPRTLEEIKQRFRQLDVEHLKEVLGDLVPQGGAKRPLLADSRQVTIYAQALVTPAARAAIRDFGDFSLAQQIVEQSNLPGRLNAMQRSLEVILNEVAQTLLLEQEVAQAAQALAQTAAAVEAVVRSKTP
jgi:hypothetical protein